MDASSIVPLAGGLGLFLLGIHHLTEGLKGFAGDALRRALQKLVSGKWSGVVSGAVFTALVQSSSAAILTVIGFVSAGLVTFPQAVAVVLGANLGTTATSWLVAVFGFKVKISAAALPMLGAGAFLWLLAKGRIRAIGAVLAGFGLVFTGIEYLQNGMAGIEWDPDELGGGRWTLAAIGALMTVVMQSSSAAGATTLVALAAGTVTLDQAFAMVVGQNIGTTATAALAAMGGGRAVKRTALAHILFNAVTGLLALIFLGSLGRIARWLGDLAGDGEGVLALASFHTLFNFAGVALFLPWLGGFAGMIERMTGRGGISAVDRLDPTLAQAGGQVAMEAAWRALAELSADAFRDLRALLAGEGVPAKDRAEPLRTAAGFVENLRFEGTDPVDYPERRVRLWHALDHLSRLSRDLSSVPPPAAGREDSTAAARFTTALAAWIDVNTPPAVRRDSVAVLAESSAAFAAERKHRRERLLESVARGELRTEDAMAGLERVRWTDGALYHAWRLADSLRAAETPPPP